MIPAEKLELPLVRLPPQQGPAAPAARELHVAGVTPFTTIDFPGRLSAVVFVQGCPWRCHYCHNPHIQTRTSAPAQAWPDTLAWLARRTGLIDAVVFSGGEPTVDSALPEAMRAVRALGFAVGLHTAGIYPQRLQQVLPLVDWVGFDVKAQLDDAQAYSRITARPNVCGQVARSLEYMLAAGVAYEVRTTIHPDWLGEEDLARLAAGLERSGVSRWVLQKARPVGGQRLAAADNFPCKPQLDDWQRRFAAFEVRSDV